MYIFTAVRVVELKIRTLLFRVSLIRSKSSVLLLVYLQSYIDINTD